MRRHPRFVLFLALISGAGFFPGCQFGKAPAFGGGGMDMFTPVKIRVHPLSRVLPPAPGTGLTAEARVELTDQFNDIGKGAGAVYFELFLYEALIPNHHGDRIGIWNFDLGTPDANKQHWDGITRTYLFKLPIAALGKKQNRVLLAATWALPNGTRLTDDMTINLK